MALTGIVIGGGNAGTGTVGVPDVLDLPQAEAEAKLRDFGLVPKIQTIEADGVENTVFSQNPAARTIRARGSTVTLLIIKAPVVPPNLGQQLEDLQTSVDDLSTAVDGVGTKVDAVSAKIDGIGTKVDGVETDDAAETRYRAILDRIDKIGKSGGGGQQATPAAKTPGGSRSRT